MHSLRKNSNAWSSPDSFVTDGGRHRVANSSGKRDDEVVKLVTTTGVTFEIVEYEKLEVTFLQLQFLQPFLILIAAGDICELFKDRSFW